MCISIEDIRKKGKTWGLSYAQSLSAYFFEEILIWMNQSSIKDRMWLKPEEFHLQGRGKKTAPNRILYYMKEISYQELTEVIGEFQSQKNREDRIVGGELLFYDCQLEISLILKVDAVTVPFKILVRPVWQKDCFPEEGQYQPVFQNGEAVSYRKYPEEMNLSECFFEMMDRLELIGDMQPYGEALRILSTQAVDGRRVFLDMQELLKQQELISPEKRWETVCGYANYKYMEKRWNKYRKTHQKGNAQGETDSLKSWPQVIALFNEFFTPLWEGVLKDEIFIGDWMPSLGRYLN